MKSWTEPAQFTWLSERIPQWSQRKHEKGLKFLEKTLSDFRQAFPTCPFSAPCLRIKIQQWFHYHGRLQGAPKPPPPPVLNFTGKRQRKLVPLTHSQAYSRMYCAKGMPLRQELHAAWKLYIAKDEAALQKYHHLFTAKHNPNLPYVSFQQVVLKDKVTTLTEEELTEVNNFIDDQFREAEELRNKPWRASEVDSAQSEVDLERQYVEDQISGLSPVLEVVCDEVKDSTNFKPFILFGGPNPKGTGGIQIFHVGLGETLLTGQTFQQFMGPLWDALRDKYGEWLNLTYTREELLRSNGSVSIRSNTPPSPPPLNYTSTPLQNTVSPPLDPSTTPSQTPNPEELSDDTAGAQLPGTSALAPILQSTTQMTASRPTTSLKMSPYVPKPNLPESSPPVSTPSESSSLDSTPSESSSLDSTPSESSSLQPSDSDPSDSDKSDSDPSTSPSHHTPSTRPPCSPAQMSSAPLHNPSWSLGPQHPNYVHLAASYLKNVPGGLEWEKLLENYIVFESISSVRPGSSKLPTSPRPVQIGQWFKNGRRFSPRYIPSIEPVERFGNEWVEWWAASQPKGRDVCTWPFPQVDAAGIEWDNLCQGGKDGLFLAIVSLGWWAHGQDSSEDSKLVEAIADVAWVVNELISFLTRDLVDSPDSTLDSPVSSSPSPPSPRKRPRKERIGPPPRHPKRARS